MKIILVSLFATVSLMACAPSSAPDVTAPASSGLAPMAEAPEMPAPPAVDPSNPPTDACGATGFAAFVGKPVTETGVPVEGPNVRYIRPGTQVTMDFRADRLNIDLDGNDIITGFRCT